MASFDAAKNLLGCIEGLVEEFDTWHNTGIFEARAVGFEVGGYNGGRLASETVLSMGDSDSSLLVNLRDDKQAETMNVTDCWRRGQ